MFSDTAALTCSNWSGCFEYVVPPWVCLSVVWLFLLFFYIAALIVQLQLLRQQSDSESSLVSARSGSVVVPKMSMNRELRCTLWENEPTSDAVDGLGECSSVALNHNSAPKDKQVKQFWPFCSFKASPVELRARVSLNERFCKSYASWRVPLDGARVSGLRCRVCLHYLGGSMKGLISLRNIPFK